MSANDALPSGVLVKGVLRASLVPTNALKKMSPTSHAYTCFVKQQFSAKLQAYLISYVESISSPYSVYK